MKFRFWALIMAFVVLSSFKLPDEEKYLAQKAANIEVFDARGNHFDLYSLMQGKPLVISPVYTRCYSMCTVISNGVQNVIEAMGTAGEDFQMISFSFDSTDTAYQLQLFEARWNIDGKNWRALGASAENIRELMSSVGYEYDYKPATGEYDHPSILIVLTPSGRVSRYIYGINPKKKDMNLAVMGAIAEKIRPGIIKGFYLRCFGFDPVSQTYKPDYKFILGASGGVLMIIFVTGIFFRTFINPSDE